LLPRHYCLEAAVATANPLSALLAVCVALACCRGGTALERVCRFEPGKAPSEICRRSLMSWRSHGHDNKSLVGALMRNDIIKTDAVATAMLQVDRGDFVPPRVAYIDAPQVIGASCVLGFEKRWQLPDSHRTFESPHYATGYNATISAPHMVTFDRTMRLPSSLLSVG